MYYCRLLNSLDLGVIKSNPLTEYLEERDVMTLILLGISQVRNDSSQMIGVTIFCLDSG
jgi:hypothetical protein